MHRRHRDLARLTEQQRSRVGRGDDQPAVPAGQGYGRFVLGQMAYYGERWDEARRYLTAFVERSEGGRTALAIALDGEIALARKTLARLDEKG